MIIKIVPFLFVLVAMALVFVAVFLPKNREVKKVAAEANQALQPTRNGVLLAVGGFFLLLSLPVLYGWFGGNPMTGASASLLSLIWIVLVMVVAGVCLCAYLACQLLAGGVPVAQAVGAKMTDSQRRSTWRRAMRAFQQFRHW